MKKWLLGFGLALGLCCTNGYGEDFTWEFRGWFGGGCFPNITFDSKTKNRVYLASDVAGLWRSDDLGEHWQFKNKGLTNLIVSQVAVAADSKTLYAATKGGLFISQDEGEQWILTENLKGRIAFSRPDNYRSVAVSALDSQKVCVGTAKGEVFCSTNYGQQWTDLDPEKKFFIQKKPIPALLFTSDAQNLYVGAGEGFFVYDFATKSLQKMTEAPQHFSDLSIAGNDQALYAAAAGKFWQSRDGGKTWLATTGAHFGKIFRLAVVPGLVDKEHFRIFALANEGWNGRVLVSDDQGQHWETIGQAVHPDLTNNPTWAWANPRGKMTAMAANPFDGQNLFKTDWWGAFRSDDGGVSWKEKIVGAPNTVGSDIIITKDAIYVATMDNGLLRSEDQGQTYQPLFPTEGFDTSKNGHVWRVILPTADKIIATSSPWNDRVNQVLLSDDGGKNFRMVRTGLPLTRPQKNTMWGEGYPRALAADPKNPQRIYLGIDGDDEGGLFVSDDGGQSWEKSSGQPGSRRVYRGLAVDPQDSQRIFWGACANRGGVYRSEDHGQTWQHVFKDMTWVFDVVINSQGVVYAAGDDNGPAVFVSYNHGQSWKLLKKFLGRGTAILAVDPQRPNYLAVSTAAWGGTAPASIFLSQDSGQSWKSVNGDLPDGAGAAAMAFSPDGAYLYLSRYAGSVYRLRVAEQ